MIGCAPAKPMTYDEAFRAIARSAFGKCAVFFLQGDADTKQRLAVEVEIAKKIQSSLKIEAIPVRGIIPPDDLYSADDLANFLRADGFSSIAEITYGVYQTSSAPNIDFHWIANTKTHLYPTAPMKLDAALRAMIDSISQIGKRK